MTPRLDKLIHTLEWVRIEEFEPGWTGLGRPPKDRGALANAFVAKPVLGLPTTVARAFAASRLAERVDEALIQAHLGDALIGHLSRDGTAIEARERPTRKEHAESVAVPAQAPWPATAAPSTEIETAGPAKKRGRPRRGEVREPKQSRIERQCG